MNKSFSLIVSFFLFIAVSGWFFFGHWSNDIPFGAERVIAAKTSWSAATTGTTWTVPTGVASITVKIWGAGGGGGGGGAARVGGAGGAGGFVQAALDVTAGENLTVVVGGGGGPGLNSSGACNQAGGDDDGGGGGGGGYSAIKRSTTFLMIAGAGGGGGAGSDSTSETGGAGGAGGGSTGVDGTSGANNSPGLGLKGLKGTASAAGAGGSDGTGVAGASGSGNTGGDGGDGSTTPCGGASGTNGGGAGGDATLAGTTAGGGGGGGGYFGGGGGESGVSEGAGGGGGGSATSTGRNMILAAGSGTTPGNSGDADRSTYCSTAGNGGTASIADGDGGTGAAGCAVILYNTAPSFSVVPTESSDPVNQGNSVTFSATATDPDSSTWYLAVCKTNAVTASNPPVCATNQTYCVSSSPANSGSANTCSWVADGSGAQNWYAFACDTDSGNRLCSSADTTNSPITVNTSSLTFVVSSENFSTLTPGSPVFATTTLSVNTNNSTGWNVTIARDDADTTMDLSTDASVNITDQTAWVPNAATTTPGNAARLPSLINSADVLAFRVMTASGSVPFISTAWWGSTDAYIDNANVLWAGLPSTAKEIGHSSASTGGSALLNTVLYYLDVGSSQPTGSYSGGITLTATMNP